MHNSSLKTMTKQWTMFPDDQRPGMSVAYRYDPECNRIICRFSSAMVDDECPEYIDHSYWAASCPVGVYWTGYEEVRPWDQIYWEPIDNDPFDDANTDQL